MEETRRLELDRMLDEAIAAQDGARIKAIRRTMEREMLECTAHTATRIKKIEAKVDYLCDNLIKQHERYSQKTINLLLKYGGWLLLIIAGLLKISLPA